MTRLIVIRSEVIRAVAMAAIQNLPLEPVHAIRISEHKARLTDPQRALYWIRLKEISEQAWIGGRQFDDETLHIHCKREYLPNICNSGKHKWDVLPNGERALKMGTGDLNVKEFVDYLTQVEAFGAELGVTYTATPRETAWQS